VHLQILLEDARAARKEGHARHEEQTEKHYADDSSLQETQAAHAMSGDADFSRSHALAAREKHDSEARLDSTGATSASTRINRGGRLTSRV
jgi:hypothetical protein